MNKVILAVSGLALSAASAGGTFWWMTNNATSHNNTATSDATALPSRHDIAPEVMPDLDAEANKLIPAKYSFLVNPNSDAVNVAKLNLQESSSCRGGIFGSYNKFLFLDMHRRRAFIWTFSQMAVERGADQAPFHKYGMSVDGLNVRLTPEDPNDADSVNLRIVGIEKRDNGDIWLIGDANDHWELDCGSANAHPAQWGETYNAMQQVVDREAGQAPKSGLMSGSRSAGNMVRVGKLHFEGLDANSDLRTNEDIACDTSTTCRWNKGYTIAGLPIQQSEITIDSSGRPATINIQFASNDAEILLGDLRRNYDQPTVDSTDAAARRTVVWRGYEGRDSIAVESAPGQPTSLIARFPYNGG